MHKTYVALGSPEKVVRLGNFNVTSKNDKMDVYYNMDLGDYRFSMFDTNSLTYKNLEKAHHSFHYSGQGHMKEESGGKKLFLGHISDGSILNSSSLDPLILGVESFFFNVAAAQDTHEQETVFLNPPKNATQYSILWLFVPSTFPQKIHPRMFYVNLWGRQAGYNICQTAALADMAITRDMQTILTVNGWEIRALFLNSLLPIMTQDVILPHPKGVEKPWRAWVPLDAHLPLSQMLKLEAAKKMPVLTTKLHQIPETAKSPLAWVKKKEVANGTNSSYHGEDYPK